MKEQDRIKIAIILTSENSYPIASEIKKNMASSQIYTKAKIEDTEPITSIEACLRSLYDKVDSLIFIDSMGVCIRAIAPCVVGDHTDPSIVCVDSSGKYVVSVLSGYQSASSILTKRVSQILGAEAIITSQTDNINQWALETLGQRFGWTIATNSANLNYPQTSFINKKPTALLLDIVDKGTLFVERTAPEHVKIFYKYEDIDLRQFELLIAVTPRVYPEAGIQVIYYHPRVLDIGISCRKYNETSNLVETLATEIKGLNYALCSVRTISSVEGKDDQRLLSEFDTHFKQVKVHIYTTADLEDIELHNEVDQSDDSITVASISEATALKSSNMGKLVVAKRKAILALSPNDFTYAIAIHHKAVRQGHIEIVGAGPGDPDLISVKGRYTMETADLILFSDRFTPAEVTFCAKEGAVVKNIDSISVEEQLDIIKQYYDKGKLIVHLYAGDPSIYETLREQLVFFGKHKMSYHITPGISSFLAAAAALESQFTIANHGDTIILTRFDDEKLSIDDLKIEELSQSKSPMCIYLSSPINDKLQQQLLTHYAPTTPIAICSKITTKDERICRGELRNLTRIIESHRIDIPLIIFVGSAVNNKRVYQQARNMF